MKEKFNNIVNELSKYLIDNNIKAQILGISGGIDSTVCAAICHEVYKKTDIPLIGRSLPTKFNKTDETTTADLVGKAFCNDYKVCNIDNMYRNTLYNLARYEDSMLDLSGDVLYDIQGEFPKQQTPIANGNIQARLRMIYLYNLASIHCGLVIDTDNLSEYNLGYWTIHGDVGDIKPIGNLWKTEVFELAEWLYKYYTNTLIATFNFKEPSTTDITNKANAVAMSLKLKPTAGLGITNNDLEELEAESYEQVDEVLQSVLTYKDLVINPTQVDYMDKIINNNSFPDIPLKVVDSVSKKHFNTEYKRNNIRKFPNEILF